MVTPKGYQCEFLDTVPDICQCKKCSLVARRLTVTSCCGESFCHACISEPKEQNKPCPECGEEEFTFFNHVKFQRQINKLQVYCTHKKKGCGWSGSLQQLEAHLDPDQDHCQYVDTKCPLNCQQTIPKNKVEQHVVEECVKRDFTCQHCNFKATYEEVVGKHLAECSYVPLQCPNRCGVTCERDVMEDHMRICRLEEVECEFSGVGCGERPRREDQEEHTRQSTQKHITLTATATMKTREIVQQRLGEQERLTQKKLQDQEQSFQASTTKTSEIVQQRLNEQEKLTQKKFQDQEQRLQASTTKTREIVQQRLNEQEKLTQKKFQDQEQRLQASTTKTREMQQRLDEQEKLSQKKLQDQEERLQGTITKTREIVQKKLDEEMQTLRTSVEFLQQKHLKTLLEILEEKEKKIQQLSDDLSRFMITQKKTEETFQKQIQEARRIPMLNLNFKIENFKDLMGRSYLRSPPMITHRYRFVVHLDLSSNFRSGERGIIVDFDAIQGDLDRELNWPVRMKFNYEVLNNYGDNLFVGIWTGHLLEFNNAAGRCLSTFCPHDSIPVSKVLPKLYDSALYFNIVNALII